jgi:hypothetical protein
MSLSVISPSVCEKVRTSMVHPSAIPRASREGETAMGAAMGAELMDVGEEEGMGPVSAMETYRTNGRRFLVASTPKVAKYKLSKYCFSGLFRVIQDHSGLFRVIQGHLGSSQGIVRAVKKQKEYCIPNRTRTHALRLLALHLNLQ